MEKLKAVSSVPTLNTIKEYEHSACGVGMKININQFVHNKIIQQVSHQIILDGLEILTNFDYRSGYNLVTDESDGAGIRLYNLPTKFFDKKIKAGEFILGAKDLVTKLILEEGQYAIGQYFLPSNDKLLCEAKLLIENIVKEQGLMIAGWRNIKAAINTTILSPTAYQKMPELWQAILIKNSELSFTKADESSNLESAVLRAALSIYHQASQKKIALHIVSQSSESIVYKGMLRPEQLGSFYTDLHDPDFTACGVAVHSRFATNTDPQWANAQPCVFFWSHNGELNSAPTNAAEMTSELIAKEFKGIYPNEKLSDSMQFDADLANQISMKNIRLDEALVRLMAPSILEEYADEINAMLQYFSLQRTPYNGPAFAVAGHRGYYIAKLDSVGLRPSRWGITEDREGNRQFHAASDDYLTTSEESKIIQKGHLEPGGMIMLTPEGELLQTQAILQRIYNRYNQVEPDYFKKLLEKILCPLKATPSFLVPTTIQDAPPNVEELQRILFSAGWDYETEDDVVRYMADNGVERTAAMGDDTNPLHIDGLPVHLSYFFHQLFAQVSAPPLDSIKERDRFSLSTNLGTTLEQFAHTQQIQLDSPILAINELDYIEFHPDIKSRVLDISFPMPSQDRSFTPSDAESLMRSAINTLLQSTEQAAREYQVAILILSDRNTGPARAAIPDLLATAAARRYLEIKNLDRRVSIVIDSYQINGPHQASILLALGAKAVYARGAYAKISQLYNENSATKYSNYKAALEKCLLKTMGKMGITDVNNYINSHLIAAIGLNLSPDEKTLAEFPSLANIFPRIHSPFKGFNLKEIANSIIQRHSQAYDLSNNFTLLPRSGYYMPEKKGRKHGYGPVVINAFTDWMKAEDLRAKLWQMHTLLLRQGHPDFVEDSSIFSKQAGFLDPRKKDEPNSKGLYPDYYLEDFKVSPFFKEMSNKIASYNKDNPTSIRDYFSISSQAIKNLKRVKTPLAIQSQKSIRALLFSGSMSQGALSVTSPDTPDKPGAHETLTRGMNAVGANSASGEGGEAPFDLRNPLTSTRSKQIASGRFGISAIQILSAQEMEIKIAQGAKPGEGGELPSTKVSIRFAAQRGGLPHTNFISPPPHHDIYSIEDLEQLIHDIKSVNPSVKVAVKLVSSVGIGTIAVGVAKAGADVINIASNSGGTGAAQQSSIKHAGLPAEFGLAEVDKALRKTRLRELVQLRVSGGFKIAEDVLVAAILGADLFELGTTAMLTLGCKMQRTCNHSCQPGVATDGHLFIGDQLNTERYFVNLAAAIQARLKELGINNLHAIRGHTELLEVINPAVLAFYDFSAILDRSHLPEPISKEEFTLVRNKQSARLDFAMEASLITAIQQFFIETKNTAFESSLIPLTSKHRSFGARIVGAMANYLEENPQNRIILNTQGIAGQGFGFVLSQGMCLKHQGTVQDGCGKSMTGGELILCTNEVRDDYSAAGNTIAGNAMLYGASGGRAFVNGVAGHRFGILLKGAQVSVEGVGDLAFEYMTSGTGMILGKAGKGLCAGASGGIVFVYDEENTLKTSTSVRIALSEERSAYEKAIQAMLNEHVKKTNSRKAKKILSQFNLADFKILIPTELDNINSLSNVVDIIKTYRLRRSLLTVGMQVWLEQKTLLMAQLPIVNFTVKKEFDALIRSPDFNLFSPFICEELVQMTSKNLNVEPLKFVLSRVSIPDTMVDAAASHLKNQRSVAERLSNINGSLDERLLDALIHIKLYAAELNQNAEGCSGCRAQSCSGNELVETGCPGGKAINTINSILKRIGLVKLDAALTKEQWVILRQAFEAQIKESPFIAYTGAACPAPCQDACTETIPNQGPANLKRGGKLIGEPVHIKDIEFYLYQVGRSLGWFDGKKTWSSLDIEKVFGDGSSDGKQNKSDSYDSIMPNFKPPFRQSEYLNQFEHELIIIGSGPAAMQIAYEALLDGVFVRMYEKSSKPGGLLMDGIPAHKFDKVYVFEDFQRLKAMGLELHLDSEVTFEPESGEYRVKEDQKPIASAYNDKHHVVVCVGAGLPKTLPEEITDSLDALHKNKIIQANEFLIAANEVGSILHKHPLLTTEEKDILIKQHFIHMDPRGKKIVVIGGGDTAQDVIRWVARYLNQEGEKFGELNMLIRGPEIKKRAILDGYPMPSRAPTHENQLKEAEVEYIHGTTSHQVEPIKIISDSNEQLTLHIKESKLKYHDEIIKNPQLKALADLIPREMRPLEPQAIRKIAGVDMIICALGFQGKNSIPLIQSLVNTDLSRVYFAGDVAGIEQQIIVGAQASGKNTYSQIRSAIGIIAP